MSVLVQKVIGRRFGDYFFPFSAGVAFSQNVYNWTSRLDPSAGMVRLVMGLGTRPWTGVGGDYPRMIGLSHPQLARRSFPRNYANTHKKWSMSST